MGREPAIRPHLLRNCQAGRFGLLLGEPLPPMPNVPGLRSPYAKLGRIVYLPRMLDKIRLNALGKLPAEYCENLGDGKPGMFDTRCCGFLRVAYDAIRKRTLEGGSDEQVLAWLEQCGGRAGVRERARTGSRHRRR